METWFEPAEPPRAGSVVHARAGAAATRTRVAEAVPALLRTRRDPGTPRDTAFWAAAAETALRLVVRELLVPVGGGGWRLASLPPADAADLARLAQSAPGGPESTAQLWAFLDAVVDSLASEPDPEPTEEPAAAGTRHPVTPPAGPTTAAGVPDDPGADAVAGGLPALLAGPGPAAAVTAPPGLAATLRDYQLTGLRWLADLTSRGLGACLADDMGLGKTVTVIALHLHRQETRTGTGPTLVVCPASLLGNWQQEIRRFAPDTPVSRFHGAGRQVDPHGTGFVLTTYATLRADLPALSGRQWGLVVADEAQHVKNARSQAARALRRLPAAAKVALTGTPVENRLADLWAILDWTNPGLLGGRVAFQRRWVAPIESGQDPAAAGQLARLVEPVLLRRRKSDPGIAPELPPRTETERPVALTAEQADLYAEVVDAHLAQIRASGGIGRRGRVLALLTALKQICNHPAHFLGETRGRLAGRSGKLELLDELVDTVLAEEGAVLVFTQYVAMAQLLERHLRGRRVPTALLHGGTPVPRREELVRRFQAGEVPVFLLSVKAAGTGLNLTRADHVVHYDRWWNPAVEQQATDRAYRIGQTRPVQVHKLLTEGTVEERIAGLLRGKSALAAAVLGGGEQTLTELSDRELAGLVELRRD